MRYVQQSLDQVLQYGQSEYVRQFCMHIEDTMGPLTVTASALQPPKLKYGVGSAQPTLASIIMRCKQCR
jgi:eukaryotic translation initiation factor 2C